MFVKHGAILIGCFPECGPQDNKMQLFDLQTASYQTDSVKATNCVGFRDYKVLAGIPGVAG